MQDFNLHSDDLYSLINRLIKTELDFNPLVTAELPSPFRC